MTSSARSIPADGLTTLNAQVLSAYFGLLAEGQCAEWIGGQEIRGWIQRRLPDGEVPSESTVVKDAPGRGTHSSGTRTTLSGESRGPGHSPLFPARRDEAPPALGRVAEVASLLLPALVRPHLHSIAHGLAKGQNEPERAAVHQAHLEAMAGLR